MDVTPFVFDGQFDPEKDFVAHVPSGLSSRKPLFEALRRELRLPDYFGYNWDALSDCLRDLSWMDRRRVVIVHGDVPPLGEEDVAKYLAVLSDAVLDWKPNEAHELVVVFPKQVQQAVTRLIGVRNL